jgi:transcriptional regulator with XRE-family HTH domain
MKHPNKLRQYRLKMGLSEKQVAVYLGFKNEKVIMGWESGNAMPKNALYIIMLATMYHVHIQDLYPEQYRQAVKKVVANTKKLKIKQEKVRSAKGAPRMEPKKV